MKYLKKISWLEITLIMIVMGVHLYTATSAAHNFPSRWFTRDDAYYYFKVAQNISEGHGSTFDGINLTNGYHPLWMLLCIPIFALARFDLILPLRVLMLVMAALSAGTSILLFRLLKNQIGQPIAFLAASYWAFSLEVHSIVTQQGMETGITALSIVLLLYMLQKNELRLLPATPKELIILGISALFVIFSRLDGIYLALIAGIWIVFRKSKIRYIFPLDLVFTYYLMCVIFIQRATLKVYFLTFDDSAIIFASIVLVIQTIALYFSGLYTRFEHYKISKILFLSFTSVTLTTILAYAVAFVLSALKFITVPRSVPIYFWVGMAIYLPLSRLIIYITSKNNNKSAPSSSAVNKSNLLITREDINEVIKPLKKWVQDAMLYYGALIAGLGVYMGTNKLLFGTFMPVSGQIKRWWGSLPNDVYGGSAKTIIDVFGLDPKYSQPWSLFTNPVYMFAEKISTEKLDKDVIYWVLFGLFIFALALVWVINRKKTTHQIIVTGLFPLFISAELHAFFYGAMAYASKHEWYWAIQMLTIVIIIAISVASLLDHISDQKIKNFTGYAIAGIASLFLVYGYAVELTSRMPFQDTMSGEPYMDTLPILENYTEPGSIIGMTGGGNTGYYISDRTVLNMDGLINSYQYFQMLKNNKAGEYLAQLGLDYVFANRYIVTNSMPYRYQFSNEELIAVTGAPAYGAKELMHYQPHAK